MKASHARAMELAAVAEAAVKKHKHYEGESVMREGGSTASRSTECLTLTPSVAAAALGLHLAPFASIRCLSLAATTTHAGRQRIGCYQS